MARSWPGRRCNTPSSAFSGDPRAPGGIPSYAFDLFQHMAAYGGLQGLLLHQIDFYAEQIAQIVLQRYEFQQAHLGVVDLDEEIKVAALLGLVPDIGAEDAQRRDLPPLGKLRLVLLQDLLDLIQGAGLNPLEGS